MPRDLTDNEQALLRWLLNDPEIPDVEALRAQVAIARVVEGRPDLPTWLHLEVVGARPAACPDGNLPGDAVVLSSTGEATGLLMLWVKDGFLDAIEHAWFTDEMPVNCRRPKDCDR